MSSRCCCRHIFRVETVKKRRFKRIEIPFYNFLPSSRGRNLANTRKNPEVQQASTTPPFPSQAFPPNTNHQLPAHIPSLLSILRCFRQTLFIPKLSIRILYHISNSCPANQAVLIPRFAVGRKWSLSHVVENLQAALLEVGGERVDPSVIGRSD